MKRSKDWRIKCRDRRERSKYLCAVAGGAVIYASMKHEQSHTWFYPVGAWILALASLVWATRLSRAADNETFDQIRRQEEYAAKNYQRLDTLYLSLKVELIRLGLSKISIENEESFLKKELAPPQ